MLSPGNSWLSPICNPTSTKAVEQEEFVPTGRSKWLLQTLQSCKDVHKRAAPSILAAVDELIRQVESEKIAIADGKEQTIFYGQRYILSSIAELFDPLLTNLMPIGSVAHHLASSIDCFLPLSSSLSKRENCKHVIDNLDKLSRQIKKNSVCDRDLTNALRENIHCIRGVLDAVYNVLPIEAVTWCDYCFRRAAVNSVYCHVHKPSNKTNYRIGKRIYKTLPQETLDYR